MAEEMFREALVINKQTLGDEHPHVFNTMGGLASVSDCMPISGVDDVMGICADCLMV